MSETIWNVLALTPGSQLHKELTLLLEPAGSLRMAVAATLDDALKRLMEDPPVDGVLLCLNPTELIRVPGMAEPQAATVVLIHDANKTVAEALAEGTPEYIQKSKEDATSLPSPILAAPLQDALSKVDETLQKMMELENKTIEGKK